MSKKEYIERQAVVDAVYPVDPENDGSDGGTVVFQNLRLTSADVEAIVCDIPAADVREVVHGYWRDVFQDGPCSWSGVCSVCDVRNDIPPLPLAHFCPNCGAQMDAAPEK